MSEFELKIDEKTEYKILSLSRWLKFISIINSLLILVLFFIWFYLFYWKNVSINSSQGGGAVIAFILALSMIVPTVVLWISSKHLADSIYFYTQYSLTKGVKFLKLFFITCFIIGYFLVLFISLCIYLAKN